MGGEMNLGNHLFPQEIPLDVDLQACPVLCPVLLVVGGV